MCNCRACEDPGNNTLHELRQGIFPPPSPFSTPPPHLKSRVETPQPRPVPVARVRHFRHVHASVLSQHPILTQPRNPSIGELRERFQAGADEVVLLIPKGCQWFSSSGGRREGGGGQAKRREGCHSLLLLTYHTYNSTTNQY